MHRQELSKIVNFVHFYEWAPIGDVCLMISKKVQHDHRPLRASFPPAIPLSKHPYPYLYLQICVSIVRSRTSLLSAKLIIGKSLPAQLLAPHMCEIKRKFHLGKTKNVSFFWVFECFQACTMHICTWLENGVWQELKSQPHTKCIGKFA